MRILRNYLLREFFNTFSLSIIVFTFVLLIGNLIKLADLVVNKGVDIISVAKLFFYLIPWLISFTLPIATLTAVILTFGRLSSDGELTAMKASGVGLFRISLPVMMVGAVLSILSFYVNDQVSPDASFASRRVIKEIGIKSPMAYLEEGTFIRGFENYVIFIHGIQGNHLRNIRIYQPQAGRPTRTIIAESGEINTYPEQNIVELKLFNGTSEEPSPTEPENFYKLNFKTYYMTLDLSKVFKNEKIDKKAREMTIAELMKEVERSVAQKIDPAPLFVEIYKKVNISAGSFVLVLAGIPLGIRAHRSERSIGFGISLIIFAVYYGLFLGGIAVALKGKVDPFVAVSLPNLVFLAIGSVAFIRTARR